MTSKLVIRAEKLLACFIRTRIGHPGISMMMLTNFINPARKRKLDG